MATFKATHWFSAAVMALHGGKRTADAPQSDAAPAEAASTGAAPSDAVAPPDEPESVPEEAVATVPAAPVSDPAIDTVLQRRLQPWRLLSARVPSTICRRQGSSRPAKAGKKVHMH